MKTIAIVGTKGGTGKTTTGGNLGAIAADAGLRTLLIDLDPVQPSLSSYFDLPHRAAGGITELIAQNVTDPALVISRTSIENLSIIVSNDPHNHLITLLLQAPDGRLRLSQLKKAFANDFDLLLIDTQGARTVMLEMVMLACDLVVSPLPPEMLSAHEFNRGMLQMLAELRSYEMLGLPIPPIMATVNGLDLTADARQIETALRETFANHPSIHIMDTVIPNAVIYRESATKGTPAHRLEYRQPGNRIAPCALKVFRDLAIELFPGWAGKFEALTEDAVYQLVKAGR